LLAFVGNHTWKLKCALELLAKEHERSISLYSRSRSHNYVGVAVSMVDRFSYSYGPASYHCGHRLTSNYSHGSASSLADFYKYSPLVYLYIVIK